VYWDWEIWWKYYIWATDFRKYKRGNMYSILETGGFQYKAQLGQTLKVPSCDAEVGTEIEFKSVLLVSNGSDIQVGTPVVEGAIVKAEVLSHGRGDKVLIFKKKRRQGYQKKQGHRQDYTEILITEISSGSESNVLDKTFTERARARVAALAKQKEQGVPLTRKEKIAQAAAAEGDN